MDESISTTVWSDNGKVATLQNLTNKYYIDHNLLSQAQGYTCTKTLTIFSSLALHFKNWLLTCLGKETVIQALVFEACFTVTVYGHFTEKQCKLITSVCEKSMKHQWLCYPVDNN